MNQPATRRAFLQTTALGIAASLAMTSVAADQGVKQTNIVVIFLDDSGFADFSPFGNPTYPTPNVSKLAAEGCRFINFHVSPAICPNSRGALLTGCDESCGLMYSNDMRHFHPGTRNSGKFPVQFWKTSKVMIEDVTPEDQKNLTKWYTEHAVDFIKRQDERPFFLYVPHSMPHVPLSVSKEFENKSGEGVYADVMMELDWSVGQIMAALRENGVEDNTLVVFTSNNGPWINYGDHAGRTPYTEPKGTSFDGSTRCACIMKMPGYIKAGTTSDRFLRSIDLMPTFAALAGAKRPASPFDGLNVLDIITAQEGAKNPHA